MTDTYQPPTHARPDGERPDPEDERARSVAATASEPRETPPDETPADQPAEADDRLVWTPPLPQYPPRLTRQEQPVQYQAPQPQATAPQYVPQVYAPSQQPPPVPAPYPQQTYAPAISGGYSAAAAPYGAPAAPTFALPAPKASKARVGRRMARRTVRGIGAISKVMFGVRPLLTVAFLIALLFAGWLAYDKWLTKDTTNTATPNAPGKNGTVALLPVPQSVQTYITAMQKGDVDGVWNTLSPQEKANRITSGEDKTVLSAIMQAEQSHQLTYRTFHYVGSQANDASPDPSSRGGFYFYSADASNGSTTIPTPMYFAVDEKGQITEVKDYLYTLVLNNLKKP